MRYYILKSKKRGRVRKVANFPSIGWPFNAIVHANERIIPDSHLNDALPYWKDNGLYNTYFDIWTKGKCVELDKNLLINFRVNKEDNWKPEPEQITDNVKQSENNCNFVL